VSKEKPLRMKASDSVERSVPEFNGNIRRGSGGENEVVAIDRDPRSVPNKSSAIREIKVGNVVRCVARGIENLELAGS